MFRHLCLWIFLLKIVSSLPAGVYVDRGGNVGASWGGYSASAGLGGLLGGAGPRGGLHAEAGTPDGHFASAGLGGSVDGSGPQGQLYSAAGQAKPAVIVQPVAVAPESYGGSSSQASSSSSSSSSSSFQGGFAPTVGKRPGSFFDDIFNIPISTLGAVNQYLNNRNRGVAYPQTVQGSKSGSNSYSSSSTSTSSSSSSASADSSANSGGSAGIDNNIYHGYQKAPPNYNDIFNIPISVLGAVNRFLNGK